MIFKRMQRNSDVVKAIIAQAKYWNLNFNSFLKADMPFEDKQDNTEIGKSLKKSK